MLAACRPFAPRRVLVTTFQAASGAGHPGVASWDLLGNVVPFIDGEEEKIEVETRKILGIRGADGVTPAPIVISAQAARVPVLDGHTEAISLEFDHPPAEGDLISALASFNGPAGRPRAALGAEGPHPASRRARPPAAQARRPS